MGGVAVQSQPDNTDVYTNLLYSCYAPRIAQKECHQAIKLSDGLTGAITSDNDSLNIVLIIGESYIKYHSPLYGYYLNTTPNMLREHKNGQLFVDGKLTKQYTFTQNYYWVMCDNMLNLNDSRLFGLVPESHLVGKVWMVYWKKIRTI